jgi:hypothetical protein
MMTGADGIAIALRSKGRMVCRARSGEIAPELGSPLNVEEGISGECLRTARILICHDTECDGRVDGEVCRALGIRSIVVMPLHGLMGIAGILEAFSATPSAFGDEQIDCLRKVAQISEAAYERERRARVLAPLPMKSATRAQLLAALARRKQSLNREIVEPPRKRRYWILAVAVIALLLISGVLWLSWRDPALDSIANQPTREPHTVVEGSKPASSTPAPPKPEAGIAAPIKRSHKPSAVRKTVHIESRSAQPGAAGAGDAQATAKRSSD